MAYSKTIVNYKSCKYTFFKGGGGHFDFGFPSIPHACTHTHTYTRNMGYNDDLEKLGDSVFVGSHMQNL